MRELVVIGLGHIGGSIALAAKTMKLCERVIGVEHDPAHRTAAGAAVIADVIVPSLESAISPMTDLVVVAVPLRDVPSVAAQALLAAPAAAVTDVTGVKVPVIEEITRRAGAEAARRFVGGHPMAGGTGSGPASASADLFERRRVVLTPVEGVTDPAALAAVEALWRGVGGEPVHETPEAHDRAIAAVSHLPHVIAFSLVQAAADLCGADRASLLSGPSYESATRVAASDPDPWLDILTVNAVAVRDAMAAFRSRLDEMGEAIDRAAAAGQEGAPDAMPGEQSSLANLLGSAHRLKTEAP